MAPKRAVAIAQALDGGTRSAAGLCLAHDRARAELGAIGTTLGIDLGKSKRAAEANPEDAVVFQPRVAPRTENRITF